MRPRPIPRKTDVLVAAPEIRAAASMRPRPIPRKTSTGSAGSGGCAMGFNEAAADTAENDARSAPARPLRGRCFNEAAADTAENAGRGEP